MPESDTKRSDEKPPEQLVAIVLEGHMLAGDTAQEHDAAGQCSCGATFYERGGTPVAALSAHRRLRARFAAHQAQALTPVIDQIVASALEGRTHA